MRVWWMLLTTLLSLSSLSLAEDPLDPNPGLGNTDSLAKAFSHALAHFSPPQLTERKQLLRSYQRRGYASTLINALCADGFFALLSYMRTRLQIEYTLPHDGILVDITASKPPLEQTKAPNIPSYTKFRLILPQVPNSRTSIVLDIDWNFPADPWKRD